MKASTVRRTILEFVLIVTGVMVALAADSWRESSSERARELRYLERLESDLEVSRVQVASAGSRLEFVFAHGLAALPYLRDQHGPGSAVGVLGSAYRASFGYIVTYFDATYVELTASVGLGIIGNEELRSNIVRAYEYEDRNRAYDLVTSDYVTYRAALRSTLPIEIQLRLREACPETGEPLGCVGDIEDDAAMAALDLLRANPEVERGLNLWMNSVKLELNRLDEVEGRLREVVAAIAAERAAAS